MIVACGLVLDKEMSFKGLLTERDRKLVTE